MKEDHGRAVVMTDALSATKLSWFEAWKSGLKKGWDFFGRSLSMVAGTEGSRGVQAAAASRAACAVLEPQSFADL